MLLFSPIAQGLHEWGVAGLGCDVGVGDAELSTKEKLTDQHKDRRCPLTRPPLVSLPYYGTHYERVHLLGRLFLHPLFTDICFFIVYSLCLMLPSLCLLSEAREHRKPCRYLMWLINKPALHDLHTTNPNNNRACFISLPMRHLCV